MSEKEVKLSMIVAASKALSYQLKNSRADTEEIMKHIIKNFKEEGDAKLAGIAAANHVLKYKERKPRATEKEIMQDLANNTEKILMKIENQDGETEEMSDLQ